MKLYNITYKLRNGKKKHHKYTYNTTAKATYNKHKRLYGKSHVILKVRLMKVWYNEKERYELLSSTT